MAVLVVLVVVVVNVVLAAVAVVALKLLGLSFTNPLIHNVLSVIRSGLMIK